MHGADTDRPEQHREDVGQDSEEVRVQELEAALAELQRRLEQMRKAVAVDPDTLRLPITM